MPAGAGEHHPGAVIAAVETVDVDDHRRGCVDGDVDHRVPHLLIGPVVQRPGQA
ncbi:hypothetical protein [Mycobacterium sp.]|uniref:hypothetical protein n=1 Tax=Mycobacterium sp. TaxID=1785 RepID=UPI0025EB57A2|nr:hypothetical protein [Mycobacterium sp.]